MRENRRQRRFLLGLGVATLALLGSVAAAQGVGDAAGERRMSVSPRITAGSCTWSELARPPLWSGSGAWNDQDLVLVDTVRRSLLRYAPDGHPRPGPPGALTKSWPDLHPISIASHADGRLVVQTDSNRFLYLDRGYAAESNVSTLTKAARDGSTIEKVFSFAPVGRDIVAFADVKTPGVNGNDRWATGIVRFSADPKAEARGFEFLANLALQDESRKYHRLGFSFVCGIGDTAYYLLMGNGTHLWRQEKGREPQDLGDLEQSFQLWKKSPQLPSFRSPDDFTLVMETVEKSSMPIGLYAWKEPASGKESLYLLSREWQEGQTRFFLSQLDAKTGGGVSVVSSVQVRSQANHLFAVPGPQRWAFVAKGPALGLAEQEVKQILLVSDEKLKQSFQLAKAQGGRAVLDRCQ